MSDAEQAAYWKEAYMAMALIVDSKNIEIAKLREGIVVDELKEAKSAVHQAEQSDTFSGKSTYAELATAHAAIAQAEQLKRIADLLEQVTGSYSDMAHRYVSVQKR